MYFETMPERCHPHAGEINQYDAPELELQDLDIGQLARFGQREDDAGRRTKHIFELIEAKFEEI